MTTRLLRLAPLLLLAGAIPASAQTFDSSGSGSLSGQYFYRYVAFLTTSSGSIAESCGVTGVMTFDGKGGYTTSSTQLYDSAGANGSCSLPTTGTYGVQPNGLAQLDNPIFPATLSGTFSSPVLSASSTEDGFLDHFIAIQASPAGVTTSSLSGQYTAGTLDFLNARYSQARQGFFTFTANGGNIGAFSVTGSANNLGTSTITQNIPGATYSLSGNGVGTLVITAPSGATPQNQIITGSKVFYLSADGNYILGGSGTGTDMIFGFKSASGVSNANFTGTYFLSGIDANVSSSSFVDSFYGSLNTNGDGIEFWSERLDDILNTSTYDDTFNASVTLNSSGAYNDGTYNTLLGNGGNAFLIIGSGQQYSLNIGVRAPSITPTSSVWINPVGVVNAASFTPITTSFAPGELVSLFGIFGAPSLGVTSLPVATTLGGVQVMVNGIAAPVFSVGAGQLTAMIPYETAGQTFATFQVIVNGTKSNTVTVYLDLTSPGIYTATQNGRGPSAVLHADFTPVTTANPAHPGETVQLYLNGLGTVANQPADGAAASSNPLSTYNTNADSLIVFIDDTVNALTTPTIQFAGLAPGLAGVYQINFTLPARGVANGNVFLGIETNESITEMAQIPVAGYVGSGTSTAISSRHIPPRK